MTITHTSLPVYMASGSALLWAGIVAGDTRRLPPSTIWRAAAGAASGCLGAYLLFRGGGPESYGFAVLGGALLLSLFQLFGLSGSPAVILGALPERARAAPTGSALVPPLAGMVIFQPLGLLLCWRGPGQRLLRDGS